MVSATRDRCLAQFAILEKKVPGLTVPQVQVLWVAILPKRVFDAQAALALVTYWQQRHHAASVSHRKRRIALHSQQE